MVAAPVSAQYRIVSDGSVSVFSNPNDSTYIVDVNFFADLTGSGYIPTNIPQTGYELFGQREQLYRISAVTDATFTSARLTIIEQDRFGTDTEGSPIGQVMAFNPPDGGKIPQVPFGTTGATSAIQAAVDSWNSRVVSSGSGGVSDSDVRLITSDSTSAERAERIQGDANLIDSISAERAEIEAIGYLKTEKYNATGSKFIKNKIDSGEKISIAVFGDSKTQAGQRGPNRLRSLMQNELGSSGYGYVVLDGGSAPGMNIVNIGGTVHDGGAGFGEYSLSGYAIELSAGDSYGYSVVTTPSSFSFHDRVTVFYIARSGDGSADITYGGTTVNVDADNPTLEKRSATITGVYGANGFLIDNVSGDITITDVVFNSDDKDSGVWFHVIGNGGYTSTQLKARLLEPLNQVVIDSLKLDHAIIRLGTNDWSGDLSPSTLGLSYDTIVSKIIESNPVAEFTFTGLEDASLNGDEAFSRSDYEKVQSAKSFQYGGNFAPLSTIIPTWAKWDSLGYADDNVHSNTQGGNLIGDFLYSVLRGDYRYKSEDLSSDGLSGLSPNSVLFSDASGTATANNNFLYYNILTERLGILNPSPLYTLDLPPSSTNSFRLGAFIFTPSGGLVWDNTSTFGLEGNLVWNINSGNKFELNYIGSSGEGFVINGAVPIKMGNFFRVESTGGLTYDNTSAEGDANFIIDAGNDFNVRLGGSGSNNFRVTWNDQATELIEAHFNHVEFGVALELNSLAQRNEDIVGLLYRETDTEFVREITLSDIATRLGDSGLAVDADIPSIITATATLDFGSIATMSEQDLTVTVTGASIGDVVSIGVPNSAVVAGASFFAWVSSPNVVSIRAINGSAASIDPISGSFTVKVFN